MRILAWACAVTALCAISRAQAASPRDDCTGASDECVIEGKWNFSLEMGFGVKTNPLALPHQHDIPIVFIPQFSYYGNRFFIDNLDVGYSLLESNHNTISLIATPAYDSVFFNNSSTQNILLGGGLTAVAPSSHGFFSPARPDRLLYLGGLEWTSQLGSVTTQLDLLRSIKLQGYYAVRGAVAMPLASVAAGSLSANLGFTWESDGYADYFYEWKATLNPFLTLTYSRPIARRWRFITFLQYERLGIGNSAPPAIGTRDIKSVYVGAAHDF